MVAKRKAKRSSVLLVELPGSEGQHARWRAAATKAQRRSLVEWIRVTLDDAAAKEVIR